MWSDVLIMPRPAADERSGTDRLIESLWINYTGLSCLLNQWRHLSFRMFAAGSGRSTTEFAGGVNPGTAGLLAEGLLTKRFEEALHFGEDAGFFPGGGSRGSGVCGGAEDPIEVFAGGFGIHFRQFLVAIGFFAPDFPVAGVGVEEGGLVEGADEVAGAEAAEEAIAEGSGGVADANDGDVFEGGVEEDDGAGADGFAEFFDGEDFDGGGFDKDEEGFVVADVGVEVVDAAYGVVAGAPVAAGEGGGSGVGEVDAQLAAAIGEGLDELFGDGLDFEFGDLDFDEDAGDTVGDRGLAGEFGLFDGLGDVVGQWGHGLWGLGGWY
jgi:hypothetical protein